MNDLASTLDTHLTAGTEVDVDRRTAFIEGVGIPDHRVPRLAARGAEPVTAARFHHSVDPIARGKLPMRNEEPGASARANPALTRVQRFWRNRSFARVRHHLTWLRRSSPRLTRAHATLIRWSGGRIQRSFIFTGGMPILVLTTTGRKSGQRRSTPLAYLRQGDALAVLASNAGSDRVPAWWLNLQADPNGEVLADRTSYAVKARRSDPVEEATLWEKFARLNPGFDEYRHLTQRHIPVILLEPRAGRA